MLFVSGTPWRSVLWKAEVFFFGKLRFLVVEFQCSMWVNGDLGCKLIT